MKNCWWVTYIFIENSMHFRRFYDKMDKHNFFTWFCYLIHICLHLQTCILIYWNIYISNQCIYVSTSLTPFFSNNLFLRDKTELKNVEHLQHLQKNHLSRPRLSTQQLVPFNILAKWLVVEIMYTHTCTESFTPFSKFNLLQLFSISKIKITI